MELSQILSDGVHGKAYRHSPGSLEPRDVGQASKLVETSKIHIQYMSLVGVGVVSGVLPPSLGILRASFSSQ